MKEISIVIPVYNSEENLFELNKQICHVLQSYNYELILVNDCSLDNSWEKIKELTEKYSNIIGINLRKNNGQDSAIMAGLNYASGQYIVIMDDDLQHSPNYIISLYNKCNQGFDICYANFNKKRQAFWKNFGSWFNGKIAELLIKKPKNIYFSPFQVIRKEVIDEIIKYKGPYPYVQGLLLNATNNVTQIEVEHHERFKGKSNYNFTRSLIVFLKLVTNFSVIPLRITTIMGILVSLLGFILVPYYLYQYYFGNYAIEGWTTLIIVILILGGLILLSLGLIGEYLGRMYLSINNNPQYVIKEKISYKK